MMKRLLKRAVLILALTAAVPLSADPMPAGISAVIGQIENKTKAWKRSSCEPLEKTVAAPFAQNAWRIELERPMYSPYTEGSVHTPGDMPKNTAEIIMIQENKAFTPEQMRPKLVWREVPEEVYTTIVYFGKVGGYEVFLKGDIALLSNMKANLVSTGGDNVYEVYASALNQEDYQNYSRRTAPSLLSAGGNAVIPIVNRKISEAIAKKLTLIPHFYTLKYIATPESAAALGKALRSTYPDVAKDAEGVLMVPPFMPSGGDLYLYILSKRRSVIPCTEAILALKVGEKALPVLKNIAKTPRNYVEFAAVVYTARKIEKNLQRIPETIIVEQIRMLLEHSGDLPGSPKYVSVSDQAMKVAADMAQAERERVAPLEAAFAKTQNVDCAIVAALSLCYFDPAEKEISREYVKRLNAEGITLLQLLPRAHTREVLRNLKNSVEDQNESDFLSSILTKLCEKNERDVKHRTFPDSAEARDRCEKPYVFPLVGTYSGPLSCGEGA